MEQKNHTQQIRKGDPLAKLSNAKNHNYFSQTDQFIGYKLNTRLRALRTAKGWSQSELGKKLAETLGQANKIPTSTIASWEHKNSSLAKIPSPEKIEALSKLFHVSIDYLKGLSDDP